MLKIRKLSTSLFTVALAFAVGLAGISQAAVLRVPSEYATIQGAIDAAVAGDVIVVAPGTYTEAIDFIGKDVSVISAKGASMTTLAGPVDKSLVTFRNGESAAAVLDGFTLTGGTGTQLGHDRQGGAVLCMQSSPTIRDCRFVDNSGPALTLGGAICCLSSSPIIDNCEFVTNEAIVDGGAIQGFGSSPTIVGCRFTENVPNAIDLTNSDLTLVDCTLENNAGGLAFGASASGSARTVRLTGCRFKSNAYLGLGLYAPAAGSTVVIEDSLIEGNGYGGFTISGHDVLFERNVIARNGSIFNGPVNRIPEGTVRFVGNVFGWNDGDTATLDIFSNATVSFLNDTIAANEAPTQLLIQDGATVDIVNSIVWNRTGSVAQGGSPLFRNCLLSEAVSGGENNIVGDPLFVDLDADLHLRMESPAVDAASIEAGLLAVDIEGDPRIVAGRPAGDAIPDIGADELRPELASRYGTVDAATTDAIADVLRANGSAGDRATREVRLAAGESIRIDMLAPPAGPATAPFALYAWTGESTPGTIVEQPFGLGWTAFATPLQGGKPDATWNNLGRFGNLGAPTLPSTPAPSVVVNLGGGLPLGTTVTLQGYIADDGSAVTRGPASVTNAIVLRVEP